MDLTYFNPNSQKEEDFIASFVARQETLAFFLKQLSLTQPGQAARHHLIVAPRGFGKTSLLRRIAIGVRSDTSLYQRFIPLRFREEQHNVISLDVLWRNCLQSLLEAREDEAAPQSELDALDAAWEAHAPRQALPREEQDGEPTWHTLREHCEALQRRPVLLIDNLDTLLAGLSAQHQWGLRKRLQADDGPVLIAAASRYPEATHNQEAAFYEFFRIQPLDRLDNQEVFTCLRNIAAHRGAAGQQVLNLLDTEPGRIAALNTMAGGNPRTLSVLYGVLESHMSGDVLSQLSAMLDTFTGWYQARTEELPMQARAVFDALALNWDPMTAAALGLATGLDTTAVSSQLSRLEKSGYVETVALSRRKTGRSGFQVSERFFNIWYLMRNGPRRAKQSIRFLTTFLQSCFSTNERMVMARAALGDRTIDLSYVLALATGIGNKRMRGSLLNHAHEISNQPGRSDEFKDLVDELRREWATEAPSGKRKAKQKLLNSGSNKASPDAGEAEVAALLKEGLLLNLSGRAEDAMRVWGDLVARYGETANDHVQFHVLLALLFRGTALGTQGRPEKANEAIDELLTRSNASRDPTHVALAALVLADKGRNLQRLNELDAAQAAYRLAIERLPNHVESYIRLGGLLLDFEGDVEGAKTIFQSGLDREPVPSETAHLHANLAYLLALSCDNPQSAQRHLTLSLAAVNGMSASGKFLLEAVSEATALPAWNWPLVFTAIGKAVTSGDNTLWTDHADDLERLLWHILNKGKGADFKQWMEAAGYPTQYAPLYHAFVAGLEGEDHLLQINPETREPASKIYAGIARRLKLFGTEGQRKHARGRAK
jgi:tetratricopeptide (TPR) repeat protein